jgi:hypothetical protein
MTFLEHSSNAIAARRWNSAAPGLELRSFAAATALVSIHIVDAEIVQPHPGTTAGDHVLATVVPLGVALFGAGVYRFPAP